MHSQKRARQASTSDGRSAVNLRIELPPPDFSQFKAPLDASTMAPSQVQRPAGVTKEPILGNEAKEMFSALKDAAVRAGEIIRYQADMKKLSNGKPIPPPPAFLVSTFAREVERLDQLHAIAVLLREAKRNEAKAQELRNAQASLPQATSDEVMEDSADVIKIKPDPDAVTVLEGKDGAASAPAAEMAATALTGLEAALSIRRVSSTAPTLSALSSATADGAADAGGKARLRQFPLKLDLSGPGLRFGHEEPNSEAKPLASPVTLAPKTARPVTDDIASAIKAMTGGLFEANSLSLGTMSHSSFSSDAQQQLAAVANAMNPMTAPTLLPSAFPQSSGDQSMIPSGINSEVIDLTQMTPSFNQTLELPINAHGDSTETIDLTMDSPTIPLSQVIASKQMETDGPAGTENADLATVLQAVDNQAAPENPTTHHTSESNTGLDGLLSFVGLSQAETQGTDDDRGLIGMASDPASILAGLTGADQAQNSLSQSGLDMSSNPFGTDTGLDGLTGGELQPFAMDPLQGMDMLFGPRFMEVNSGMGDSVSDMFGAGSGGLGDLSMLGMNSEEPALDIDSLLSAAPARKGEGKDA